MNNEERIRVMDNFCFGSAARVGFEQQGARDVGVAGAGFEKQGAQGVQDFNGGAGGNVGAGAQGAGVSGAQQGAGCVVLCADIDCVNHPEIIGLGGENLMRGVRVTNPALSVAGATLVLLSDAWVLCCALRMCPAQLSVAARRTFRATYVVSRASLPIVYLPFLNHVFTIPFSLRHSIKQSQNQHYPHVV